MYKHGVELFTKLFNKAKSISLDAFREINSTVLFESYNIWKIKEKKLKIPPIIYSEVVIKYIFKSNAYLATFSGSVGVNMLQSCLF